MTTDNRMNEPSEAQVEAAAKEFERVWDENIDSFDPEQHDAMSYIKTAMRAALVAAQGAPQEPNQNETKSEKNFVSLAPEKVKIWLQREFGSVLAHDPHNPERFWGGSARALCEAYTEGKLT